MGFLRRLFGNLGGHIEVVRKPGRPETPYHRKEEVWNLYQHTNNVQKIADFVGLSVSTVRKIVKNSPQVDEESFFKKLAEILKLRILNILGVFAFVATFILTGNFEIPTFLDFNIKNEILIELVYICYKAFLGLLADLAVEYLAPFIWKLIW